ncbi:MAG: arginase family protein [Deltaproteobacteria bacterium]|nr:arginase family protein [Deltaproteobacteria bacterium]
MGLRRNLGADPLRLPADLLRMLRPAGGGLFSVSSGSTETLAFQKSYYECSDGEGIEQTWLTELARLREARVILLGIPSDTGAGLVRGAAYGPRGLRAAWLGNTRGLRRTFARTGVVDVGDVLCVPHFLHDEMLSEKQKRATRAAIYPDAPTGKLPVSPLSVAEAVCRFLLKLNPRARLLILGGDHSVAWPVFVGLNRHHKALGVVHLDAHTDLLPARQGVRICFATWAHHANRRLGRGRLVQLGVRASAHDRAHWEKQNGLWQLRADELLSRPPRAVADEVARHLAAAGASQIYLSNDIDGTDGLAAPATGTPELGGLQPDWVKAFIGRLGRRVDLVAADLVEVAPPVGDGEGARKTLFVGTQYLQASLDAMLRAK